MAADALIPDLAPDELSSSALSSRLRSRTRFHDSRGAAEHRVIELLLALGLADEERIVAVSAEVMQDVPSDLPEAELAACAIERLQVRVDAWRSGVFGENEGEVHPLWMRAFLAAHPEVFLGDVGTARARVQAYGDPFAGRPPARASFQEQSLRAMKMPLWAKGLLPPLVLAAATTLVLVRELAARSLGLVAVPFVVLFFFLSLAGAIGLCTAIRGVRATARAAVRTSASAQLPRTALVMPIYHESAEHVFAALLAMRESLARLPGGDAVEVFVLSDSRDAERIAEEERAFRRTAALGDKRVPIYYRRRARNEHQKAGNLAEFFERFGHRYTYAVILDADSILAGETILEMIRRMEASPELGLLQAKLELHGARTVFARTHQLAASVYGPALMRGLSVWSGDQGNYYGHNAIVRVRAFLDCCALPRLRGEPPLGGQILSHDFVEAALLCRSGWAVRSAPDLDRSYEELPPTLMEYVARDKRWCQGNLQHLRVAQAEGLSPMSRLHMWIGASAYLAGPAWLAFVCLGAVLAALHAGPLVSPGVAVLLSVAAAAFLLGPRLVGLMDTLRDRERRAQHGGAVRLTVSVAVETLSSLFVAPILMLHHTRIVASLLLGSAVTWGAQSRRGGSGMREVLRAEALTTLFGAGTFALCLTQAPGLLPWLAPVYVPWLLAIPVVAFVSSERVGDLVAASGLYRVPTESAPDELLVRADALRAFTASDEAARFRDLVLDPVLLGAKLELLKRLPSPSDRASLDKLVERALRVGPAALTDAERTRLCADAASMRRLHREAWQRWPVEHWAQGREVPQLPKEYGGRAHADTNRG